MIRTFVRRFALVVVVGVGLSVALAACSWDEPVDRMQAQIAERASDPEFALTTTVPGAPMTLPLPGEAEVLDDPELSFHTAAEVTEEQFEMVRRAAVLAKARLGFEGPIDVYVYVDPETYLDEFVSHPATSATPDEARVVLATGSTGMWADGSGAVFLNGATIFETYPSGKNAFLTTAHEVAHVAQERGVREAMPTTGAVDGDEWPVWLAEGHAELVAFGLARDQDALAMPWPDQRSVIVELASAHQLPLAAYEVSPFPEDDVDGRYSLWYLAAELLAPRVSSEVFDVGLWNLVGAEGWEAAFTAVFGQTLEEFYAEFDAWRAQGFPEP